MLGIRNLTYRLLLLIACVLIFTVVNITTKSIIYALAATVGFVLLYLFVLSRVYNFNGRDLKKFISSIAKDTPIEEVDFDDERALLRDYVKYGNNSFVAAIKADKEGIFIFSVGLFSGTIPWKKIISIYIFEAGNKLKARLKIDSEDTNHSDFVIGWESRFESFVPSTTALNKR